MSEQLLSGTKYYYKIIDNVTSEVLCYVSINANIKAEKLCDLLGFGGMDMHAEPTTQEEYVAHTDDDYEKLGEFEQA